MIISDSTTLIILFDLDRLELLSNLFKKIYLPSAVYSEITYKGDIELPSFMEVVEVGGSELLDSLQLLLDVGESEAIALAKERGLPLIIDEKKGRKIAQNIDIKIIGLLGVIYLNITKEYLSKEEAMVFLTEAKEHGYCISKGVVDEMLATL
ncbi:MAG: hypothetical protein ABFR02_08150 [Campylobacterota bacterium]